MKTVKLKDIAEIQNGYQERVGFDEYTDKKYRLIQSKNVSASKCIDYEGLEELTVNRTPDPYLVKKSDILFCSRGGNNAACTVSEDYQNLIAGHSLFILRLTDKRFIPEFVKYWLNSKRAKHYFASRNIGAVISFVNKSVLGNLELPLLSKNKQLSIAEYNELINKQSDIYNRLISKREQLLESIVNKQLKGE